MGTFLYQVQDLSWTSSARRFDKEDEMWASQPNYEHEVAYNYDTRNKYQGVRPEVGGWGYVDGRPGPAPPTQGEIILDRAGDELLDRFGENVMTRI
jgi:hypothetical protein